MPKKRSEGQPEKIVAKLRQMPVARLRASQRGRSCWHMAQAGSGRHSIQGTACPFDERVPAMLRHFCRTAIWSRWFVG